MARDMVVKGPTLGTPQWAGDFMSRDHLLPAPGKLDPTLFVGKTGTAVTLTANAAAAAVAIVFTALTAAIPSGTVLDFGTTKYARTTAAAAIGATTVAVAALPTALVIGDTATVSTGTPNFVASGTLVGRTIAERDAGTGYGPFADTDPASETYLVAFDITDVLSTGDVELYRPGSTVYETYLPGFAALSATAKAMVRSRYLSILAVD